MVYSSLLKSTALLAGLAASVSGYQTSHYQTGSANLVKRATELGNTGITYDIVEEGLSTDVTFAVDFDDVIVIKGYVVSSEFSIVATDSGFSVSASYDNATQFCESADMWMLVYSYDGSTPALIAPDCSNVFTLLEQDGSVIDWTAGGCISIGSLAAANPACASVSASSTASTIASSAVSSDLAITSAPATTFTEIIVTETVQGTETIYTTYCPLTSGTPDFNALSTSYTTVSDGTTTTVVIPCTHCAAVASSAAAANTESLGLFVETAYVSGTVTVTSMVPCETTAAPTTYTEIVVTQTVKGTETIYTTYCPLSSGTPVYSALSTVYTTVSEGSTTTVTVECSECAAAASSAVKANTATTGALYVPTTVVSGTVTVTSFVECSTTEAPTSAPTSFTEIIVTKTVEGTATVYTTYCPMSSGTPVYSALSTSYATVSEGSTTTVTVECSECAAEASSAVKANTATTGNVYIQTIYTSSDVTVTTLVTYPQTTPASTAPTVAQVTVTNPGETLYTTVYTTAGINGDNVVVTSVGTTGVPAVQPESSSSSPSASVTALSVFEGAAPMKFASTGLVGAALALLFL